MTEADMFLVKEFQASAQELEVPGNPAAPIQHMILLQFLCEVGGPSNLQGSPAMFLTPDRAKELGRRLIREAKTAMASARSASLPKQH